MKYLRQLILMIQFLTRIPIKATLKITEKDFAKGFAFAPLVGLIIGAILFLIYKLTILILPLSIVSILLVISYLLLTGGLHFDGLGDTFDGIFSGRAKERVMEIMKDSRVGTYAVLVTVCVILLDIALIYTLLQNDMSIVLVLFPVAGRLSCTIGAGAFSHAGDAGLGKSFIERCGIWQIIIGTVTMLIAHFFIGSIWLMALGAGVAIISYLINLYFSKKISGVTGDILGASCELSQSIYLLGAVIMFVTYNLG